VEQNHFTGCFLPGQNKDENLSKARFVATPCLYPCVYAHQKEQRGQNLSEPFWGRCRVTFKLGQTFYQLPDEKETFKHSFKHTIRNLLLYQPGFLVRLSVFSCQPYGLQEILLAR